MSEYRVVVEATSYATYIINADSEYDAKEEALELLKEQGLEYNISAYKTEENKNEKV